MEIKKSPKADLQNKKGLFLEIGLIISLLATILMFSWSQKEKVVVKLDMGLAAVEQEIVEITFQDEKPPEPQQTRTITVTADILRVVRNDAQISTNLDFSDFNEDVAFDIQATPVQETAYQEEEIFLTADEMPTFQGGDLNGFRNWVQSRLKYPQVAHENGIQGRVIVTFVVEKDGSVSRIQVLAAPDKSLGEEAARIIASSPKWEPGKQRGNPVLIRYSFPVEFKIQ